MLGSAFRSTSCLHVFVRDCYEIHKQCRRRLSCQPKATRYRLYFTAVCREVKNCITTHCHFQKKLHSAELRPLCSRFHFVLFLSCVCRQQWSLHGKLHVSYSPLTLSVYKVQTDNPKTRPKIRTKSLSCIRNLRSACATFFSALTNAEL